MLVGTATEKYLHGNLLKLYRELATPSLVNTGHTDDDDA